MVDNSISKAEKSRVVDRVREKIGPLYTAKSRRPDWYISRDNQFSVFVTFSRSDQLFYDVNQEDLKEWEKYPESYVIFVLGDHSNTLIVPVTKLYHQLKAFHKTDSKGNYKLHIREEGRSYLFRELPRFDLKEFLNNYEQFQKT